MQPLKTALIILLLLNNYCYAHLPILNADEDITILESKDILNSKSEEQHLKATVQRQL
jgi:hypothetical protein